MIYSNERSLAMRRPNSNSRRRLLTGMHQQMTSCTRLRLHRWPKCLRICHMDIYRLHKVLWLSQYWTTKYNFYQHCKINSKILLLNLQPQILVATLSKSTMTILLRLNNTKACCRTNKLKASLECIHFNKSTPPLASTQHPTTCPKLQPPTKLAPLNVVEAQTTPKSIQFQTLQSGTFALGLQQKVQSKIKNNKQERAIKAK